MKKLFTTLCLLMLSLAFSISTQAEEAVYDFSTSIPSAWTSSMTPKGYETSGSARGTQFMENGSLTLKGAKDVTKVVVECSCNIASGSSISLSVGGTTWGTENLAKESGVQKSFTGASASGDVVLSLSRTEKSIWIKTITVTCGSATGGGEGGEGGEGEGGGDATDLDPNYTYAEPTVVTCPENKGNNMAYSFIQNNIKVECSTGAMTDNYFGCNAGQTITFTATKAIKGISIDGYVKKGFDIDVSAGSVEYYSDDEEDVEANPVVLITDIDAKTVTLNCVKQMRCYNVSFYFVENPDGDIDDGGGDEGDEGDYTYEYEPTEATTLNITFDEMEYADYSEYFDFAYTDLYFISDDYEMELVAFAPAASGTALAPGTYQITSDYAEGTIQASPGGDDMYDYPSYIAADFEEYDGEWYYNSAYYLVSGTLTVEKDPAGVKMTLKGKTYYGSTVNATFVGKPVNYDEEEEGIDTVSTTEIPGVIKQIRSNQIIIRQGKHSYDLQGRKM